MRLHIVIPALLIAISASPVFAQSDSSNPPRPTRGSAAVQTDRAAMATTSQANSSSRMHDIGSQRAQRYGVQPDQENVPGNPAFGHLGTP